MYLYVPELTFTMMIRQGNAQCTKHVAYKHHYGCYLSHLVI